MARPTGVGLRTRVAIGVILLGAFLLVLQTVAVLLITEYQEEAFVDQILLDEAQRLQSESPGDTPGGLIRYVVHTPAERAQLPAYLRDLQPGLHEHYVGDQELHLLVQPAGDAVYYLLYDATRHENRTQEFRNFLLIGVAISIALLVWAGVWMAGRLVRQVTDLSTRVEGLDPAEPQPTLAPDYHDAEVVTLAHALDGYARRVTELLTREQAFTADVSHELRTPLTTIRTGCELLLEDQALNAKSRQRVERMLEGADRMTEVVDALLMLAREAPMSAREPVALRETVEETIAAHALALDKKRVPVEVDIPSDATLLVHRTAFALVLGNLLRNAITYTDQGRIVVRYDSGALSVSDTGTGIATEDLPRVFERSFRGSNARHAGSGIGLAIVKRVCDRFGWRVGVASEMGTGATFTVNFSPRAIPR